MRPPQPTPDVLRRAFEIFDRVRAEPAAARDALIESDASLSDEVRSAVRDLLAHDSPTGEFLGMSLASASADLATPLADSLVPHHIGRYRVIREIGRGGFGRVYLAEQESPRRMVAVKVLRAGSSATDARRMLFEAEALARLDHPAIARVYECGTVSTEDARPFIAMEYVEGVSIDRFAAALGFADRCAILEAVCDGIEHAHRRGVLHRDLATKNILVDATGRPRVIDFGLASTSVRDHTNHELTIAGTVLGTLRFMSPEQLSGRTSSIDTRTDVFALGVIAFELLTGEHPYITGTPEIGPTLRAMLESPVRRSAAIDRILRGDTGEVLRRCVERDPARRYQSAAALAADLRALRLRLPVAARSYGPVERFTSLVKRHKRASVLVAGIGLLVLTLGVNAALSARREANAHDAAVNVLDALLTHVVAPLSPRVGTVDDRERLLLTIEADVRRMAERAPTDPRVARIAGAYFGARGDLFLDQLDYPSAAQEYSQASASYERAIRLGDDSIETAHAASLVLVKSGDAWSRTGGPATAAYRRALEIDQRLADAHPRDLRVLSNLFWSHWRHAETLLCKPHGSHSAEAARVADAMVRINATDWRTLECAARVETRRGIEAAISGDNTAAFEHLSRAHGASASLIANEPDALAFLKIHIEATVALANTALDLGRSDTAGPLLEQATAAVDRISAASLDDDNRAIYILSVHGPLARLALARGDHPAAVAHADKALEGLRADLLPEHSGVATYIDATRAMRSRVEGLRGLERHAEAEAAMEMLRRVANAAASSRSASPEATRWFAAATTYGPP